MARRTSNHVVTIADVAARARVSTATVSYVINDKPSKNLLPETRERVLKAARELGYRPSTAARSIRTQQSNLIGFITDEIATTPYAGAVIKGAQDVARLHNKLLLLINTDGDAAIEHAAVETLLEHRVEGIIFATMYHQPVVPPAGLREARAVLLDCFCADRSIASVVPDEFRGGYDATRVLLAKGHRGIGFLNVSEDIPAARGRLAGYRQALEEAGLPFDPELVRYGIGGRTLSGYAVASNWLQEPNRPTALFCFNDRMAMGVYDAARQLGLSIPHDLAVVGFDNQRDIADVLHPGLSTMTLPHYEMGTWAVRYLLGETEDAGEPVQKLLDCPFVERGSA